LNGNQFSTVQQKVLTYQSEMRKKRHERY
jgi:hypothetical protein